MNPFGPGKTPLSSEEIERYRENRDRAYALVGRLSDLAVDAGRDLSEVYTAHIAAGCPALDSGHPFWVELERAAASGPRTDG